MSQVYEATGRYAKEPYRLDRFERNIYTLEELAYILIQSAQYLDSSVMDPELVDWIDVQLGLPDLSERLRTWLGHERALTEYVSAILDAAGNISRQTALGVRKEVSESDGLMPIQKSMRAADDMLRNGHAFQAIDGFISLRDSLPDTERHLKSDLSKKAGIIYTGLFRFQAAAEMFLQAFHYDADEEAWLYYLTAVRLSLSPEEYVDFIAEHPECYETSLTVEANMNEADSIYEKVGRSREIRKLTNYMDKGQMTGFEVEFRRIMNGLKSEYRLTRTPYNE